MNRDTTPQFYRASLSAASLDLAAGSLRGKVLCTDPLSSIGQRHRNTLTAAERLREDLARAVSNRTGQSA